MKSKLPKQLLLPGFNRRTLSLAHGGEHTAGKRKTKRPFDPKQALHVVLRSSKARGRQSLLHPRHVNAIGDLVDRLKKRWNVRVYRYANVGNHIHLLIRAKSRAEWQGFIRELSGGIAMRVTGARKGMGVERTHLLGGQTLGAERAFWDHLVFTRIVAFGRDFMRVGQYVLKNLWEAAGIPLRRYLAQGYRVLELDEEGFLLGKG